MITGSDQIGASWLSQALHESGALRAGQVPAVEARPASSAWSKPRSMALRSETLAFTLVHGDLNPGNIL